MASPKLVEIVYDICEFTTEFVAEGRTMELWTIDYDRINDDASWDDVKFHPRQCHECHGYDLESVKKAVQKMDAKLGGKLMEKVKEYLPTELITRIQEASEWPEFDFYKEWNLQ